MDRQRAEELLQLYKGLLDDPSTSYPFMLRDIPPKAINSPADLAWVMHLLGERYGLSDKLTGKWSILIEEDLRLLSCIEEETLRECKPLVDIDITTRNN